MPPACTTARATPVAASVSVLLELKEKCTFGRAAGMVVGCTSTLLGCPAAPSLLWTRVGLNGVGAGNRILSACVADAVVGVVGDCARKEPCSSLPLLS